MPGNGIMTPSIVDQAPTPTGPTQGITFLQKTGELEA
jgi:hypothetical protein